MKLGLLKLQNNDNKAKTLKSIASFLKGWDKRVFQY